MITRALICLCALLAASIHAAADVTGNALAPGDQRHPHQLNLSLVVFDPGIPSDTSSHRQLKVFPEIRKVEARFLPFVLRRLLTDTGKWGAVRVVPNTTDGAELTIIGHIIKSDGETLQIRLQAIDALGRSWIDDVYAIALSDSDTPQTVNTTNSMQRLFDSFVHALDTARTQLNVTALQNIQEVALLQYAGNLLPGYFASYLSTKDDGTVAIARLPARDDPMLARVKRVRQFEYLFTDTLDEQYRTLYSKIVPSYNLWLRYQERLTRYRQDGEQRKKNHSSSDKPGSYSAILKSYENYKWIKMEEQNLRNWAAGFNNEVGPTVVELDGRVVQLGGSLEQRYTEWREILGTMLNVETGVFSP